MNLSQAKRRIERLEKRMDIILSEGRLGLLTDAATVRDDDAIDAMIADADADADEGG